jgi:hypothetical protein
MADSADHVAEQLFKILKGFGHTIILFTDEGKKTTDPTESRRFYANDIKMMVNLVVDTTTNEIIVNLSDGTDIKTVKPMLASIRNLANQHIIEYTVKTFGKSITPRDFAYQAKRIGESNMSSQENKRDYDRNQKKLATLSKERNAAKKDGRPWKATDAKEKEFYRVKAAMNEGQGLLGRGMSPSDRAADVNQSDIEYIEQRDFRNKWKATNPGKKWPGYELAGFQRRRYPIDVTQVNEIDCWDGYKKQGTKKGTGMNKDKRVNNCVPEGVAEGFSGWKGSARKSVNELNNTRIIIRHSRNVDEERRGARTRQIESIFIENVDGERFKFPNRNITAAKAMARHVQEGGTPFDDFGQHIYGVMEEIGQLKKFQRNNKKNDFFEDAAIGEEITSHIGGLRKNLHQMAGPKGYKAQFESFTTESADVSPEQLDELKDNVTVRYFDENISESLPYVARIIEALRSRQASESHIVEFARQVMNNTTGFTLSESCDDDDPEGPAARIYKDQVSEVAAWAAYLSPKVQNEELSTAMTQLEENLSAVSGRHVSMAAAAINVIRQQSTVAETTHIAEKKVNRAKAEIAKINESMKKYDIRKIFDI